MSELKNGDRCYISNVSASAALEGLDERVFIGFGVDGRAVCQSVTNKSTVPWEYAVSWEYAIPIPEKKVIPYTFETWPRGVVYVEFLDEGEKRDYMVCSVTETGIMIYNSHYRFSDLAASWQMSTDLCKSWKPCSQEVE